MWLTQLFGELSIKIEQPVLYIDNLPAINQIKNGDIKRRSKHVELKYHYIRKLYNEKIFILESISTDSQPADLLTKALGGNKIEQLLDRTRIFNRNMAKNKVKGPGYMAKIALALVMIHLLGSAAEGFFQQAPTSNLISRHSCFHRNKQE